MAFVPPAAAGIDPWAAYREKYGPVSTEEKNLGVENATAQMALLDKFNSLSTPQLSLDGEGHLDVVPKSGSDAGINKKRLADETQKVVDHLYQSLLTLPPKAKTIPELIALVNKESRIRYLQDTVLSAYKASGCDLPSLNSYDMKFVNYKLTLGKTEAVYTGDKIEVKIVASKVLTVEGNALKIELKGAGREFASVILQLEGDKLNVFNFDSPIEADPQTHRFDFITLLIQVVFNIWEKQATAELLLSIRRDYLKSADLGLHDDGRDHSESYQAPFLFRRELCNFDYFKKVLNLSEPIVPKP